MTRDEMFAVVQANMLAVRPDLDPDRIRPDRTLIELDLSSLDRLDVLIGVLDELRLPPRTELLAGVRDLGGLTDVLLAAVSDRSGRVA